MCLLLTDLANQSMKESDSYSSMIAAPSFISSFSINAQHLMLIFRFCGL